MDSLHGVNGAAEVLGDGLGFEPETGADFFRPEPGNMKGENLALALRHGAKRCGKRSADGAKPSYCAPGECKQAFVKTGKRRGQIIEPHARAPGPPGEQVQGVAPADQQQRTGGQLFAGDKAGAAHDAHTGILRHNRSDQLGEAGGGDVDEGWGCFVHVSRLNMGFAPQGGRLPEKSKNLTHPRRASRCARKR